MNPQKQYRCSNCRAYNPANAVSCSTCGALSPSAKMVRKEGKQKRMLLIVVPMLMVIFIGSLIVAKREGTLNTSGRNVGNNNAISQSGNDKLLKDYIESIDIDADEKNCDVRLTDDFDWQNLHYKERREIARYCIEKCRDESGIIDISVFGYLSTGELAFNNIKTFVNGKPAETL